MGVGEPPIYAGVAVLAGQGHGHPMQRHVTDGGRDAANGEQYRFVPARLVDVLL